MSTPAHSTATRIPVRADLPPVVPAELADRPQLTPDKAGELESLFKVLASDTRLRLLHELARHGELCVSDLAEGLGMTSQAVSNQLQRLMDQRIVDSRRDGNRIHYRIVDCCVGGVMELGLCLLAERPPTP
jgi:DNA-binding transcriptional ArsR family regulator